MMPLQRMTPAAYGTVKAQLKARDEGGWQRVAWSLARRPHLHELELLHARLIATNPKVGSRANPPIPARPSGWPAPALGCNSPAPPAASRDRCSQKNGQWVMLYGHALSQLTADLQ